MLCICGILIMVCPPALELCPPTLLACPTARRTAPEDITPSQMLFMAMMAECSAVLVKPSEMPVGMEGMLYMSDARIQCPYR